MSPHVIPKTLIAFVILFVLIVGIAIGIKVLNPPSSVKEEVSNFEDCIRAGYPVMESFPRQCRAGDEVFTEEIAGEDPVSQGDGCQRTGCSGQICSDEDVTTTCEFRPEYACYQAAVCERQLNGECGWRVTSELAGCLEGARP